MSRRTWLRRRLALVSSISHEEIPPVPADEPEVGR